MAQAPGAGAQFKDLLVFAYFTPKFYILTVIALIFGGVKFRIVIKMIDVAALPALL